MSKPLFVILLLIILCQSCIPRLPKAARDLAFSAICDFPPLSGNSRCQRIGISRIVSEVSPDLQAPGNGNLKRWCLELNYVDYTGQWGNACIWLAGPDSHGDYLIQQGPEYDVACP